MVRRSSRLSKKGHADDDDADNNGAINERNQDDDDVDETPAAVFAFNGVIYRTYQDMVNAKRERNQKVLEESGLLNLTRKRNSVRVAESSANQNGLKKQKFLSSSKSESLNVRKSRRLAGIQSDGKSVDEERRGKFSIVDENGASVVDVANDLEGNHMTPRFYRERINDGSNLSIIEAVQTIDKKWINEDSIRNMKYFAKTILLDLAKRSSTMPTHDTSSSTPALIATSKETSNFEKLRSSPNSVVERIGSSSSTKDSWIHSNIHSLSVEDDSCVSKVCPDRIYGISIHPSLDRLIVSAGDKVGNIGIWDVDHHKQRSLNSNDNHRSQTIDSKTCHGNNDTETNNGVYLYRVHNGSVPCLSWTSSGSALVSTSYDGTVRWFDTATQTFEEIFATYDDTAMYKKKLGYGLDIGYKFWTQYSCFDHRYGNNEKCMFLATSIGTAMHIDLRTKNKISFHEQLSEKKINTLSLHPNGYSIMSAGLDNTVRVWDLRNFGDNRTRGKSKGPEPVAYFDAGKSVNSSYFSPSGKYAVATTMAQKLDIYENIHLGPSNAAFVTSSKGNVPIVSPIVRKYHDNMTGRWLSTFMACYHPNHDIFCVGSMDKPRAIEIFDGSNGNRIRVVTGAAMTAVSSRCCFHPCSDRIIIAGGNSSGRVTIVR